MRTICEIGVLPDPEFESILESAGVDAVGPPLHAASTLTAIAHKLKRNTGFFNRGSSYMVWGALSA
jgi:hypothetical protein